MMDATTGIGAALAAMREDEGRYDGCVMLSALPSAPVVTPRRRGLSDLFRAWAGAWSKRGRGDVAAARVRRPGSPGVPNPGSPGVINPGSPR